MGRLELMEEGSVVLGRMCPREVGAGVGGTGELDDAPGVLTNDIAPKPNPQT